MSSLAEQVSSNNVADPAHAAQEFIRSNPATRDATLAAPTLTLPSLQVNIQAGALPAPSAKGRVFLRLPVNAI